MVLAFDKLKTNEKRNKILPDQSMHTSIIEELNFKNYVIY